MSLVLKSQKTPNAQRLKGARNLVARADKARRRQEAQTRQALHDKLTIDEKIGKVLARGGSVKELLRLIKVKEAAKNPQPLVTATVAKVAEKISKKHHLTHKERVAQENK